MWPFRSRSSRIEGFNRDFNESCAEMAEKQRREEQGKKAVQELQDRAKAEQQAELESIGRRQTEVRCKDGTLIVLRGVEILVRLNNGLAAMRAERLWDPTSTIRHITIPVDNILCVVSTNRGDDATPETSIAFTRWKD